MTDVTPPEPVEARDPACPDCERTHPWRDHGPLPEPVEARDLTAAIHSAFVEVNGECLHFDKGHGPYAQCKDPGECVPVRGLSTMVAALRAEAARPSEGLDSVTSVHDLDVLLVSHVPLLRDALVQEARAAAYREAIAALDAVPSWDGDESFVMVKDVIAALRVIERLR